MDLTEHIRFLKTIYKMTFETVFTVPEAEATDTAAQKKRKHDKYQEIFERLREAADAKIRAMEVDIYGELESRFEAHRLRVGDLDIDQLLRAGTASASATTSGTTNNNQAPC